MGVRLLRLTCRAAHRQAQPEMTQTGNMQGRPTDLIQFSRYELLSRITSADKRVSCRHNGVKRAFRRTVACSIDEASLWVGLPLCSCRYRLERSDQEICGGLFSFQLRQVRTLLLTLSGED